MMFTESRSLELHATTMLLHSPRNSGSAYDVGIQAGLLPCADSMMSWRANWRLCA
jgi:hypothetical protein